MRISAIIIMGIITLCLLATPAMAEQKILQSGMQHIIVTKPKAPERPEVAPIAAAQTGQQAEQTSDEKNAAEIWSKYKELAAGLAPQAIAPEQAAQTPPQAASPTGIAAIIADYRKNKESQRTLKTLSFTQPGTQTITTPNQ